MVLSFIKIYTVFPFNLKVGKIASIIINIVQLVKITPPIEVIQDKDKK